MKSIIKYILLFLSGLLFIQCDILNTATTTTTTNQSNDLKKIFIEKKTVSFKIGETKELIVTSTKSDGIKDTFTANIDNENATVSVTSTGISIKGVSIGSAIITVTSGSGLTSKVNVLVFDPVSMDIGNGLLIKFTYSFDNMWDDGGSGGDHDTIWWHPKYDPTNGWYPVGSYIRGDYADANKNHAVILVKDSKNNGLLAKPTDYTLIYNDSGSGANRDGSVWLPIAPTGYVAMGIVVQSGHTKPSTDVIRCVKKEYTVEGKSGNWIYDDSGTGASMNLTVWDLIEPDNYPLSEGAMFLDPGTVLASSSGDPATINNDIKNVFIINIPVTDEADNASIEPKLTGFLPYSSNYPKYFSSVRIPFTLIKDSKRTLDWKVDNSPFYFIQREEVYTDAQTLDNRQATTDNTMNYSSEIGFSKTQTDTFTQEVGMEVTAEGSASFLGSGGKWSVKLSAKLGWQQQTATTYSFVETKTYNFTVPAGKYAQLLHVTSQFRALDSLGNTVNVLPMKSNSLKYMQYP
ncbi:MAG: hypothetical protein A2086_04570 [Spirochaetes bacterium GWD1_27_9]|nr:MAG: hypothetical protein A2Z98_13660 [Spirochaetes bacterium GWB1_27_13]OHD27592.1 MAG: hypothetical protein A2Y34_18195 [Spirochaetes bacterium GWC1_27_15]OHD30346.1 MAG: hypothetical protein A2086_04570 [Spirochaetes bacterium GWD1_27_9]